MRARQDERDLLESSGMRERVLRGWALLQRVVRRRVRRLQPRGARGRLHAPSGGEFGVCAVPLHGRERGLSDVVLERRAVRIRLELSEWALHRQQAGGRCVRQRSRVHEHVLRKRRVLRHGLCGRVPDVRSFGGDVHAACSGSRGELRQLRV
jgi:hypothetical protein